MGFSEPVGLGAPRAIPRRQKIGIAGRNCSWTRSFGTSQISEQNCGQSRPLFPGDAKIAPFPDAIALQNRPLAGAKLTPHAPAPPLSNPSNNTRPPRALLWRMDNRSVAVRRPPCVFLGFEIGGTGVALTHFFSDFGIFSREKYARKKIIFAFFYDEKKIFS